MPTLVFIHVSKTGGTSFRQWLVEYFSGDGFIHESVFIHKSKDRANFEPTTDVIQDRGIATSVSPTTADIREYFKEHGVARLGPFQAVAGHFTFDYPFMKALARPILVCSLVRDPVERTVSLYNWVRLNKNHKQRPCVEGKTLFQSLKVGGPFLESSVNKQIDFILGKGRSNCDWTIVCNIRRMDFLIEKIVAIYGHPMVPFPHRNRVDSKYRAEVEAQPDFPEAVNLIRALNAEEIEFVNAVGDIKEFNR